MSGNPFEKNGSNEAAAEDRINIRINIGEVSEAVQTGLGSLKEKWQPVRARDEVFLSEAEKLFTKRHNDRDKAEGTPEKINEYFRNKGKDLQALDSSARGDAMSSISDQSIEECELVFLDKVVNSASPKEVSTYAVELLRRVSRMLSDAASNRIAVQKIKEAVTKTSYNMFGYDSEGTTAALEKLYLEEKDKDKVFFRGFENAALDVKTAVNTLASERLQQLQKSG